jgi:uncharacterized protein (TIGR01777 family)
LKQADKNILITGGKGFLGSHLIPLLESQGKMVKIIGRSPRSGQNSYVWDVENRTIDLSALSGTETIIHLAGAGIANKRWTKSYKKEIIESRIKSAALLFETLKSNPNSVHTFISASAIGYYGDTGNVWAEEDFHETENFLGETCKQWEASAKQFESLGIRVVIFRIGIVLAKDGGVLPIQALPVKFFVGSPLGTGEQFLSWIHIDDLCNMFSFAIDNKSVHGTYNAVAPGPVTNKEFIRQLGKAVHRPIWPVKVPAFILKIILGEKASIVLESQRVSSEKIRMAGFNFLHIDLQKNLNELL